MDCDEESKRTAKEREKKGRWRKSSTRGVRQAKTEFEDSLQCACCKYKTGKKNSFCSSFNTEGEAAHTNDGWQKSKSRVRMQAASESGHLELKNKFEAIQEEDEGKEEEESDKKKKTREREGHEKDCSA
eukprot:10744841-Karenia_brevis.AAC.1